MQERGKKNEAGLNSSMKDNQQPCSCQPQAEGSAGMSCCTLPPERCVWMRWLGGSVIPCRGDTVGSRAVTLLCSEGVCKQQAQTLWEALLPINWTDLLPIQPIQQIRCMDGDRSPITVQLPPKQPKCTNPAWKQRVHHISCSGPHNIHPLWINIALLKEDNLWNWIVQI